jgi:hypothetical protein
MKKKDNESFEKLTDSFEKLTCRLFFGFRRIAKTLELEMVCQEMMRRGFMSKEEYEKMAKELLEVELKRFKKDYKIKK